MAAEENTPSQFLEYVNQLLRDKRITIQREPSKDNTYLFRMKYEDREEIGHVTLRIIQQAHLRYPTRASSSAEVKEVNGVYVPSLYIYPSHQGRGYGTTLLLYALCTVFHPDLQFIALDDVANDAFHMRKNIYLRLGFVPTGLVELRNKSQLTGVEITGEKTTTYEHLFTVISKIQIPTLQKVLEYMMDHPSPPTEGGKRKRQTRSKGMNRRRKTKRTRR